jgi:Na+-translocating ferredoxin:NAD+ oxidoreductase RnfG subunit
MRTFKALLFFTVIVSLVGAYITRAFIPDKTIDEKMYLQEVSPGASFSEKKGYPPHYRSDSGMIAFNSFDITPSIRGYAGPIKILLVLSPDGKINAIKLLEHTETKNYVHYMETAGYLGQFSGKTVHDPFEVDNDIDGISRATVSVEALAETVRESSRSIASQILKIDVRTKDAASSTDIGWLLYLALFSVSFTFYFLSRHSKKFLRARDVSLLTGILLIGFYLSSPFSILHIFNLLLLRPSSAVLWYVIVISTAVSVIIAGRFYCGWLCPFGALAEFISRVPSRKWEIPSTTDDTGREIKYILLGLTAVLVFISGRIGFGNYETYITFFSFHGNFLAWLLVGITLLSNLKIRRFWCRYLCPVAALTGLCSRKDSRYISSYDCPMANKPQPFISECIRCNRCYSSTVPHESSPTGKSS